MNHTETIRYARWLLQKHGVEEDPLAKANLLDFCELVKSCVIDLSPKQMEKLPDFRLFSEHFRAFRDDAEMIVKRDPPCLYTPQHDVALHFHKSLARIRNFYGGNRISKTQAGGQDDYWMVTGQHPWRPNTPLPAAVFVIGSNFSKYGPNVFEKKWITGEGGNPLSPIFPEGGKWFHKYDERKKIIYICCPACAEEGKAKSCKHLKGTVTLFSDMEGPGVLAGGQYVQGHFDEQIKREFLPEASQRIKTVPHSGLIITETPLYGKSWWTYTDIFKLGEMGPPENVIPGTERKIVENFTIDQFSAGLVQHDQILADMKTMSKPEIDARIYGKYISASDTAVFDLTVLSEMREEIATPKMVGLLKVKGEKATSKTETAEKLLTESRESADIRFTNQPSGLLRVWQKPKETEQYIIGADVAEGMTKRDYSSADVLKMSLHGTLLQFEQVAHYHGWVNSHMYAEELYKLGSWYHNALLVVESNGPGNETIRHLKSMGCPFLFRDISDPSQAEFMLDSTFGVDINVRSKGMVVSILQGLIRLRKLGRKSLVIHDSTTIDELESYVQAPSESGLSFRFQGEGTSNDDCVMSLAVATYVATSFPVYDVQKAAAVKTFKQSRSQGKASFAEWYRQEKRVRRSA